MELSSREYFKTNSKRGEDLMGNDLVSMIGNVGFPIAVSVYLLVRLESKLEVLTSSINNLSNVINNLNNGKK